ncbi:MAG: TerB family tellurite resistance protein [Puia sp.]|nr:TerB family tellurite resistance protein [Puia sp.]
MQKTAHLSVKYQPLMNVESRKGYGLRKKYHLQKKYSLRRSYYLASNCPMRMSKGLFGLLLGGSLSLGMTLAPCQSRAQSFEMQQLLLDIQKLAQLKNILGDLYKSYAILDAGYTSIRDIAHGNFSLHQAFLDAMLAINPTIRNDHRVTDILNNEAQILSAYRITLARFKQDPHFSAGELGYFGNVYSTLLTRNAANLGDLLDLLTPDTFRMSDDERLSAIDRLYGESREQVTFIQAFNDRAQLLSVQRAAEQNDVQTLRQLYQMNP